MGDYLKAKSGNKIYYKMDKILNSKASILINHGFAEHLGRYDYLADKLNKNGYNVYRYDLRGHGRSGISKGYIDSYSQELQLENFHQQLVLRFLSLSLQIYF